MTSKPRSNLNLLVTAVAVALISSIGGYWLASRSRASSLHVPAAPQEAPPIVLPKRSEAERPAIAPTPEVPATLANPPDLTAEIEIQAGAERERKIITRSAERVHVKAGEGEHATEWLFVRNPVDPRLVSASFIDHSKHAILEHDETSLRNAGIARGWADIARMAADAEAAPKVIALHHNVDKTLLADPRTRFPDYTVVDAIDWLEKTHDHGGGEHTHSEHVAHP